MFCNKLKCFYICTIHHHKYIKIMTRSATYEREIKKAYVYEGGYLIASYDFNSTDFDTEIEMSKAKANECFELMEQAKTDDEYFVSMEE